MPLHADWNQGIVADEPVAKWRRVSGQMIQLSELLRAVSCDLIEIFFG